MEIAPKKALKPLRQLRRLLVSASWQPAEEAVHALRTRTRRVETLLLALGLDGTKRGRKLLEQIKPLRKTAGRVRDMDVLLGFIPDLAHANVRESALRLAEQLNHMRARQAQALNTKIARKGKKIRQRLKRERQRLEEQFVKALPSLEGRSEALALELAAWLQVKAENLHDFRLKVKSLLDTVTLSNEQNHALTVQLRTAKDVIGGWHDWDELSNLASTLLDPAEDRLLLIELEARAASELTVALKTAKALRQKLSAKKD